MCFYGCITKVILIPLVFISGGIEAVRAFLNFEKKEKLERENKIP